MAATLAGEAAIRIVPSLRGFKPEADRRLKTMQFDPIKVRIDPGFKEADAQMDAWRARQRLNAVNVPVKADFQAFRRDLSQVEHIFKRNALSQAIRLNIKVIGLDALPALAYAAGSATSGLNALADSALILPGLLSGALASVGALAVGLHGVSAAFKAFGEDQKNSAKNSRDIQDANRDLARSYDGYRSAVRDTVRSIQDLNAENRRSSLNVADAVLSVQEAADKLRQGGQRSILELRRDQLSYAQAIDHLQEVQVKANRTMEDATEANRKGVQGSDAVVSALDRISDATDKLTQAQKKSSTFDDAISKLAPNAQEAVRAITALKGQWDDLQGSVQNHLFEGVADSINELASKALPGLKVGLSGVASGLNGNFKSIAESLGLKGNQTFLERIFGDTKGGLDNLRKGMNPLIEGFLRLSKESADFLPRLGKAGDAVFNKFNNWTKRISEDGSFDRWMDNGLKAITSIGNAAGSIGHIVSQVSNAFDEASGHQGGFLKSFADVAAKYAKMLDDPAKFRGLVDYFKQAKEFTDKLREGWRDMKPMLADMVQAAREWSAGIIGVAGGFLKTAAFIERNTGALTFLLQTYLSFKVAKPIIDAMTTSWKNYTKVVEAAAKPTSPLANNGLVQQQMNSLRRARGEHIESAKARAKADADAAAAAVAANRQAVAAVASGPRTPSQLLPPSLNASDRAKFTEFERLRNSGAAKPIAMSGIDPAVLQGINRYQVALADSNKAAADAADKALAARKPVADLGDAVDDAGKKAKGAAQPLSNASAGVTSVGNASRNATGAVASVGNEAKNAAGKIRDAGEAAGTAGEKVGGGSAGSFMSRLKGLGAFLGPQLGFMVAIGAAETAIFKMGEAHRKAAEMAKRQKDALDALKTSLDPTTGAFTAQTLQDQLQNFQKDANVQGVPGRTGIQALQGLGMDARDFAISTAPVNAAQFDRAQLERDQKLAKEIEQSDTFRGNADAYNQNHITSLDLAKAARGDSASLEKVRAAEKRQELTVANSDNQASPLPNMTDVVSGLSDVGKNLVVVGQLGQHTHDNLLEQGANNAAVGRMQAGKRGIGPAVGAEFGKFGLVPGDPKADVSGAIHLELNGNPSKEDRERLTQKYSGLEISNPAPGTGIVTVTIPPELADSPEWFPEAPKFAKGGLVRGAGGPTDDKVLARVSPYEHITRAKAVQHYGVGLFDDLNNMRIPRESLPGFAPGGWPLDMPQPAPGPTPGLTNLFPAGFLPTPAPAPAPAPAAPAPAAAPTAAGTPHLPSTPGPGNFGPVESPVAASVPLPGPASPGVQLPGFTPYGLPAGTSISYGAAGFPAWVYSLGSQYGVEASTYAGHQEKSGTNRGLDFRPAGIDVSTPEGAARMDQFAQAMMNMPGVEQVIWENPFTGKRFGRDPGDRGANQSIDDYYANDWKDHKDHVHIRTSQALGGLPSVFGGQGYMAGMPGAAATQGSGLLGGVLGGLGLGGKQQKQSPLEFFTGLASNVGGSLTQIALGFLSGMTGLDLNSMFGVGSSVVGGLLGGSWGGGDTGATDIAGQGVQDYLNGSQGMSPELAQMLSQYGISAEQLGYVSNVPGGGALSQPGRHGGEAYRSMIRAALQKYGPGLGITNFKAWEDALVKQIDTESGGDPFSQNDHDSNGQGGTQSVTGLLNFLPSTFNANNITGGSINDPMAQIAAALPYVVNKWKMNPDGSPRQIGLGQGFANGGFPQGGNAWLSNGEFRTSAAATKYYGPGLFNALNSMALPKFADGGFPFLETPTTPGQSVGPMDLGAPAPAPTPAPAPSIGLPGPADAGTAAAPSTGAAPGPGATAPAPDPGALPGVSDAMTAIGGAGQAIGLGGQGDTQPGAEASNQPDPRGTLGAAPASMDHNNPALDSGIKGAFNTIGSLAGTAAAAAMAGGTMGAGAMGGSGAASSLIAGGAQLGGDIAAGAVNVLSSLLVGSATGGSTASASGTPLLPQRQDATPGVAPIVNDNRTYQLTNLDEYKRMQERSNAQQMSPYLATF